MPDREKIIQEIEKKKIIVIMRGFTAEQLLNSVEAMTKGGIGFVEITFDQSGITPYSETAANIKLLSEKFRGRAHIGAGTVMTENQVEIARGAGAEFIISPDCCREVIEKTRSLGMVSIPGAFTPTEAAAAHRFGADFVKLFPNSEVKPSYLKALCAPLSHIKFLAVGGINADNAADYLAAGAKGVGVASAIADKKLIFNGKYEEVYFNALNFTRRLSGE